MDRDSLVYKARLAEQAERFDEMVSDMKDVARQPQELTVEERNLLSVAYKNVIGSRRASWRVVTSIEQKGNADKMEIIKDYKAKIEAELVDICNDIIGIVEESLIPNSTLEEAKVFYFKMKGDYHRYLSEFQVGDARKDSASAALDAYQAASGIATSDLPPTHPIRLGLALNFSVFYYEILNSPDRACQIAKQAFDDAVAELDRLNEEVSYNDTTLVMQLLRDNLILWTRDESADFDAGNERPEAAAEDKDTTLVMQLLRDNLILWTSDESADFDAGNERPEAAAEDKDITLVMQLLRDNLILWTSGESADFDAGNERPEAAAEDKE